MKYVYTIKNTLLACRILAIFLMISLIFPGMAFASDIPMEDNIISQEPTYSEPVLEEEIVHEEYVPDMERYLVGKKYGTLSDLENSSVSIIHDYGSFVLVDLDSNRLENLENLILRKVERTISMDSIVFKPSEGLPDIPDNLRIDSYQPGEIGYFIVQFIGPVDSDWTAHLETMGVQLIDYLPYYAFTVSMKGSTKAAVEKLPYVDWVGIYQPAYKIHSKVQEGKGNIQVKVLSQDSPDMMYNTLSDSSLITIDPWKLDEINVCDVSIDSTAIESIASDNSVYWIEPNYDHYLMDEVSCEIVGGNFTGMGSYVNDLGYDGTGVIVSVADTGLDDGVNSTMHPDLSGRVDDYFWYGSATDAADGYGHGTHCAGIIAGNGAAGSTDANGYYYGYGVAPGAHIVGQKIFSDSGNWLSPNFNDLARDAIQAGADIGSNSWGANAAGDYNVECAAFDVLVRDADNTASGSQQYILEFSAGNSGSMSGSIGSPAAAKNVIATGASENFRPVLGSRADNINQMASFSSRGPCDDGRYKPDIVAPGTWIASALSSSASPGWGWNNINTDYEWCGGTSMSGPIVSGGAALFVQYYMDLTGGKPSPALTKSALINGAVDMPITGGTASIPNNDEGWGRMNLTNVMGPELDHKYHDQDVFLTTGQDYQYTVDVLKDSSPLKITMAYTDAPGAASANPALVNNLDLAVTAPNGATYHGNQMIGGWSIPNPAGFDSINNIECVYIQTPLVGQYTIDIDAINVPSDGVPDTPVIDQDFALTFSGEFGICHKGFVSFDKSSYLSTDNVTVEVTDLGLNTNPLNINTAVVEINSTTELVPEIIMLYETDVNSSVFSGFIITCNGTPSRDGFVQVTDGDMLTVTYYDADDGNGNPYVATDNALIDDLHDVAVFNIDSPANGEIYPTDAVPILAEVENRGVLDSFDVRYELGTYTHTNLTVLADNFDDGNLAPWTWTGSGGRAGVSTATSSSGAYSMYTQGGVVSVISNITDTSSSASLSIDCWIRRGSDAFSEDPDGGEDLVFEYRNNVGSWIGLETFAGSGTAGQIMTRTYIASGDVAHSGFQLRFRQTGGSGLNMDYWHIDDVSILSSTFSKTILDVGTDTVIDLPSHDIASVFGNTYTFTFEGLYYMDVETLLGSDEDNSNNLSTSYFSVANIHDVGVSSINYPANGVLYPTGIQPINVTVINNGTLTETFDVECIIRNSASTIVYNAVETVSALPYNMEYEVIFSPPWNTVVEDDYTIDVTTLLGTDADPSNNWMDASFTIDDIYDVGVTSVISPLIGGTYALGAVEINATVNNFGNVPATFITNYTIGTVNVTTLSLFNDDFESGAPGWGASGSGSSSTPTNVALFQATNPWRLTSNQDALNSNGIPYTIYSQSFIGTVNLSGFDKVIVVMSGGQGASFLSAVSANAAWFEAYANSGGVLEIHLAPYSSEPIGTLPGGYISTQVTGNSVDITIPGHELLINPHVISDAELDGWGSSYHRYLTNWPSGSEVILNEGNSGMNWPVLISTPWGGGTIVISSQTLEWAYNRGTSQFLENVLLYNPEIETPWEVGNPAYGDITNAHSGSSCWGTNLTNNYVPSSTSSITSPSFDFSTGTTNEELSFWHTHDFYNTEAGGIVEISTDNSTWIKIDPITGNTWYSASNAFGGANAFTGDTYRDWYQSSFDLSSFSGNSDVRVRFSFQSTNITTCHEGWYIDDVVITGQSLGLDQIIGWGDELVSLQPGEEVDVFGNSHIFNSEGMYYIEVKTLLASDENSTNDNIDGFFDINDVYDVGVTTINSPAIDEIYPVGSVEINGTVKNYGNVPASFITNYTIGAMNITTQVLYSDDFESGAPGWDYSSAGGGASATFGDINTTSTARHSSDRTYLGDYQSPIDGTITQVQSNFPSTGNSFKFKVMRNVGGNNFQFIAESGWLISSMGVASYAVNIPNVLAGDYIGLFTSYPTGPAPLRYGGGTVYHYTADHRVGTMSYSILSNYHLAIAATITPPISVAWDLGTPAFGDVTSANSGFNCWGTNLTNNYLPNSDSSLISPSFDLSGGYSNERLTFWHAHDFFATEGGGIVEVSTDNMTWIPIVPITGNTWYSASNAFGGANAFTGDTYRDWYQSTCDLSPFNGNADVRIRFTFHSTPSATCNEGWYIDDIVVTGDLETFSNPIGWGDVLVSNLQPGEEVNVFGNTHIFTSENIYYIEMKTLLLSDENSTNNQLDGLFEIDDIHDVGVASINSPQNGSTYGTLPVPIDATVENYGNVPASFITNYTLGNYTFVEVSAFQDDFETGAPGWTAAGGTATFDESNIQVIPFVAGNPQPTTHSFTVSDMATGNGMIYLDARDGDFDTSYEYIDVRAENLAGTYIGRGQIGYQDNANWQPVPAHSWTVTAAQINAWAADGTVNVICSYSAAVDDLGGNNEVRIRLTYPSINTPWEHGIPANGDITGAHSGTDCWGTDLTADYIPDSDASLTSPSFDLTLISMNEVLSFWHTHDFYNTEAGGIVEISTDPAHAVWTKIDPVTGITQYNSCNAFAGDSAFTGDTYQDWYKSTFDLSAYGNFNDVQIRFKFKSTASATCHEGWFIDDVNITGLSQSGLNVLDTGEERVVNLQPGEQFDVFGHTYNFTKEEFYWLNVETRQVTDENNANNLSTSCFEIYNYDDMSVVDIAPFEDGAIYSTGNYSINATIKNYGNYYASGFNVTCEIRDDIGILAYTDTQTISRLLIPGEEMEIDFVPSWNVTSETDYTINVFVNYTLDEDNSNDRMTRNFTIDDIYDVGVLDITSLVDGLVYTTGSYEVSAIVKNFGNIPQSGFITTCRITDRVGITVYSCDYSVGTLMPDEEVNITFAPSWNALVEEEYTVDCFTMLAGDEFSSNNRTRISVIIDDIHDAAIVSIDSHANGATYPTGEQRISVNLTNLGNVPCSSFVTACTVIRSGSLIYYSEEIVPANLMPGAFVNVQFTPYWNAVIEDTYLISVETRLLGDAQPVNDNMNITIIINNIYDLGVISIDPLVNSTSYPVDIYSFNATIQNFGNVPTSGFEEVYFEIRNSFSTLVYSNTVIIGKGLLPGDTETIKVCPDWNATVEDFYSIYATTTLAIDENRGNDYAFQRIEIDDVLDLGVVSIDSFLDNGTYPGGTYSMEATLFNHGHIDITNQQVECRIISSGGVTVYTGQYTMPFLAAGASKQITFSPDWSINIEDSYSIEVLATMPGDENTGNNMMDIQIFLDNLYDVNVVSIESFTDGGVYHPGNYFINGTIRNNGNVPITGFDVSLSIIDSTNTQVYYSMNTVAALLMPGEGAKVSFLPAWVVSQPDQYRIKLKSLMLGDETSSNDEQEYSIRIDGHDVGVIDIPGFMNGAAYNTGNYQIDTVVKNFGPLRENDVKVQCNVRNSLYTIVFTSTYIIPAINPGEEITFAFTTNWTAAIEDSYTIEVLTMLDNDYINSNNQSSRGIFIDDLHDIALISSTPFSDGNIYMTGLYTINATLDNLGDVNETNVLVNCTIRDSLNNTAYTSEFTLLNMSGTQTISFAPDWNALVQDDYMMFISIIYPTDENPTNDILAVSFTIGVYHDIAIVNSTSFSDGCTYPTGTYIINGTIENYGTGTESPVFLNCEIFDSSNVSIFSCLGWVMSIDPGEEAESTFIMDWDALVKGDYMVRITNRLGSDQNNINDRIYMNITIDNLHDIAVTDLHTFLNGETYGTGTYSINATVENLGTIQENNITVNCTIRDSLGAIAYSSYYMIPVLDWGTAVTVSFLPVWAVGPEGDYNISITSYLATDVDSTNNQIIAVFTIDELHDIKVTGMGPFIFSSSYNQGDYTITAEIVNNGTADETNITINCRVTDGSGSIVYWNDVTVASMISGESTTVTFLPDWGAYTEDDFNITITTSLASDENTSNDLQKCQITIDDHHDIVLTDFGPLTDGGVFQTGDYNMTATITNMGTIAEAGTIVNCTIYDSSMTVVYFDQFVVPLINSGQIFNATFTQDWSVDREGSYWIYYDCWHPLDEIPANDVVDISVTIDEYHDMSLVATLPFVNLSVYPAGSYTIDVTIENLGTIDEYGVEVVCMILDSSSGIVYRLNQTVAFIAMGDTLMVSFSPDWTPLMDDAYTLIAVVELATDENNANDPISSIFYIDMTPPVADPGSDNFTFEDSIYFFDGNNSYDLHGIINYTWDFGDGQMGYGPSLFHTYYLQGVYFVNLTVMDTIGLKDTDTLILIVYNVDPTADAGANLSVFEGDIAYFNASGSTDTPSDMPLLTYTWWFGDGNLSSLEAPTHRYNSTGTYLVTLEVMDDDGAVDYAYMNVTVLDVGPVAVPGGPYVDDEGSTISFDASGSYEPGDDIILYEWDWNNDGMYDENSTGPLASHIWNSPGIYSVFLRVTDEEGTSNEASINVTVNDVAPVALPGGPYAGNEGTLITFNGSASHEPGDDIVLYEWDLDNDGIYENIGIEASITRYTAGVYTIWLRVTDEDGSIDIATASVDFIDVAPIAVIIGGPCVADEGEFIILDASDSYEPGDDIVLYEWDVENDGIYDYATFSPMLVNHWDIPGTYTVVLRVTDEDGSTGTAFTTIVISNIMPIADPSGPYQGLEGQAISFNAGASYEPGDNITFYEWDWNNDGVYDEGAAIPGTTHQWDVPGTYSLRLRVTDEDGTMDTAITSVSVRNVAPVALPGGPYLATEGTAILFDASGSYEPGDDIILYEWDFDYDRMFDSISGSPISSWTWYSAGMFNVHLRVTDADGSTASATVMVTVSDVAPEAVSGGPYCGDEGVSIRLDASASNETGNDIVLYEWDWNCDGTYDEDTTNPRISHTWHSAGVYTVWLKITDEDGSSDEDSTVVNVNDLAPVADAGGPYVCNEDEFLILDASDSTESGDDIVLYEWDWDNDGTYDHNTSATWIINAWNLPGIHIVALRVTDEDGSSDVAVTTVIVMDVASVADLSGPYQGLEGQIITFNADYEAGDDIILYEWDWNNDGIYDVETNVAIATHQWDMPGSYMLRLRVTDEDGTTAMVIITVDVLDVAPTAVLTSDRSGEEASALSFDASNSTEPGDDIILYEWDWESDGIYDFVSSSSQVQHIWYAPGIFTVTLRVTDEDGSYCLASSAITIENLDDVDGDGYPDVWEAYLDTDPLNPEDMPTDTDGDGIPDGDAINSRNWMDLDDDNDGTPDEYDPRPLDPEVTGEEGIGINYLWLIVIIAIVVICLLAFFKLMGGEKIPVGEGTPEEQDIYEENYAQDEIPEAFLTQEPVPMPEEKSALPDPHPNQAIIDKIKRALDEGNISEELYSANMEKFAKI